MTAIDQLRQFWKSEPRPERAAWAIGDSLETRAILELDEALYLLKSDVRELAGRVDVQTDPSPEQAARDAENDRKTLDSMVARIRAMPPEPVPEADEPLAGLEGYAVLSGNTDVVKRAVAYKHLRAATILGADDEVVIDLSKIPASAIVKPEPKRWSGVVVFAQKYGDAP